MTMPSIFGFETLRISSFGMATFSVAGMAADFRSVKVSFWISEGSSSFVRCEAGETSQPSGRLARSS